MSYNLGKNKMKQLSPPPPPPSPPKAIMMVKARRSKNAPFWHHWNVPLRCSIYFVQDCSFKLADSIVSILAELMLSPGQTTATSSVPTKHIATLLGATCCVRLATVLRCVATCWVLLAQIWPFFKLEPTTPNRSQHVATRWPKDRNYDLETFGILGNWSLTRGGRNRRFDCIIGYGPNFFSLVAKFFFYFWSETESGSINMQK